MCNNLVKTVVMNAQGVLESASCLSRIAMCSLKPTTPYVNIEPFTKINEESATSFSLKSQLPDSSPSLDYCFKISYEKAKGVTQSFYYNLALEVSLSVVLL